MDPVDVLERPGRPPDFTLQYRDGGDAEVDVRLPPGGARTTLVIVIHGGFWRPRYDRQHAAAQSEGLADAGYVVATVEYRRVGWPGLFDDIALLSDTVPELVSDRIRGRFDPQRPVLVGHSAGGHLACWAAARHRLPGDSPWHRTDPLPLAGVVSLSGVVDLHLADRLALGDGAPAALLGGSVAGVPDRFAVADPTLLLPAGVRTVSVHGEHDDTVPVAVSRSYVSAARAAGDQADLRVVPGAGHFDVIDPLTPAWAYVLDAIADVTG
jgi:acetyl esterase/lipase